MMLTQTHPTFSPSYILKKCFDDKNGGFGVNFEFGAQFEKQLKIFGIVCLSDTLFRGSGNFDPDLHFARFAAEIPM